MLENYIRELIFLYIVIKWCQSFLCIKHNSIYFNIFFVCNFFFLLNYMYYHIANCCLCSVPIVSSNSCKCYCVANIL